MSFENVVVRKVKRTIDEIYQEFEIKEENIVKKVKKEIVKRKRSLRKAKINAKRRICEYYNGKEGNYVEKKIQKIIMSS